MENIITYPTTVALKSTIHHKLLVYRTCRHLITRIMNIINNGLCLWKVSVLFLQQCQISAKAFSFIEAICLSVVSHILHSLPEFSFRRRFLAVTQDTERSINSTCILSNTYSTARDCLVTDDSIPMPCGDKLPLEVLHVVCGSTVCMENIIEKGIYCQNKH
jgi:hypothetical protein